ncbi:o-succinylbenzoate synthase [Thalassotalea aquiviva]|uniref:o-succinylbenzoate synthase n=1 Tax=Thalassotalea aquiviva TaxID=3242415 RepID=UPI00352ACEB3
MKSGHQTLVSFNAIHNTQKVTGARLYQYRLPFAQPLFFNSFRLKAREGFFLQLQFNDHSVGWGEASPLPGFSLETMAQCQQDLTQFMNTIDGSKSKTYYRAQTPAAQFAIDCALNQIPIHPLSLEPSMVPLLQGTKQQVIEQYKTLGKPMRIKLKVARQPVDDDIALLTKLGHINPRLKCHLDANQGWTKKQAWCFLANVSRSLIEVVEEPCQAFEQSLTLAQKFHIRLAIDESLFSYPWQHGLPAEVSTVIVKPSLIGGFKQLIKLIETAKKGQQTLYFSSSFESPLALSQIVSIAQMWADDASLGLDTLKYFQQQHTLKKANIVDFINGTDVNLIWQK